MPEMLQNLHNTFRSYKTRTTTSGTTANCFGRFRNTECRDKTIRAASRTTKKIVTQGPLLNL